MPTPKNLLKITELGEISFVDKGDNPPAGAVILKSAPSNTTGGPVAEDIEKQIAAAVAKAQADAKAAADVEKSALEARIAKMEEAEAVAKVESFCKSAGLDVAKLAAPIRAIEKAAPEAAAVVKGELERLSKGLAAAVNLGGAQRAGIGGAVPQNARIEKAIAPLMANGLTREAAITKAITDDPTLYSEAN